MKEAILKNKFFGLWIPVIIYAGFIFYLSSRPQRPLPLEFPFLDKILHVLEYLGLGFLLTRAMKNTYKFNRIKKLYFFVAAIAFIYGLTDELHQSFVPGRIVSFWDVVSDGLGGLLGALVYR